MDTSQRPGDDVCIGYHRNYVAKVPDGCIVDTLESQQTELHQWLLTVPVDQLETVHEGYGWSIRQVIEHCLDAERVFGYRLLRFAAGDSTDLPGWDEGAYAASGYSLPVELTVFAEEFAGMRASHFSLLRRIAAGGWDFRGTADGKPVSARTLAWLMAGHWQHHLEILRRRLGQDD